MAQQGYIVGERLKKQLEDMLRWYNGKGNKLWQRRRGTGGDDGGGGGGGAYRVKTLESAQTDGTVNVKKVDADGVVTGDDFDVYLLASKESVTIDNYRPAIGSGEYLLVADDQHGAHYLVSPPFIRVYSVQVATALAAVDTGTATPDIVAAMSNVKVMTSPEAADNDVIEGEKC